MDAARNFSLMMTEKNWNGSFQITAQVVYGQEVLISSNLILVMILNAGDHQMMLKVEKLSFISMLRRRMDKISFLI